MIKLIRYQKDSKPQLSFQPTRIQNEQLNTYINNSNNHQNQKNYYQKYLSQNIKYTPDKRLQNSIKRKVKTQIDHLYYYYQNKNNYPYQNSYINKNKIIFNQNQSFNPQRIAINGKTLNQHLKSFTNQLPNEFQLYKSNNPINQRRVNSHNQNYQKYNHHLHKSINSISNNSNEKSLQNQFNYNIFKKCKSFYQSPVHAIQNYVDRQIIHKYHTIDHQHHSLEKSFKKIHSLQNNPKKATLQEEQIRFPKNQFFKFKKYFNEKYNSSKNNSVQKLKKNYQHFDNDKKLRQALSISNDIYAFCKYRNYEIEELLDKNEIYMKIQSKQAFNNFLMNKNKKKSINNKKRRRVSQFQIQEKKREETIEPWSIE